MKTFSIFYSLILLFGLQVCKAQTEEITNFDSTAIKTNNTGSIFYANRNIDSATYYFMKAIQIDSTYYVPRLNLITLYNEKEKYQESLYQINKILALYPDFAETWFMAGIISEKLNDSISAQTNYQKALSIFERKLNANDKTNTIEYYSVNIGLCKYMLYDVSYQKEFDKISTESIYSELIKQFFEYKRNEFLNELLK